MLSQRNRSTVDYLYFRHSGGNGMSLKSSCSEAFGKVAQQNRE